MYHTDHADSWTYESPGLRVEPVEALKPLLLTTCSYRINCIRVPGPIATE